jgi:long-subunit fatty acid transport protein
MSNLAVVGCIKPIRGNWLTHNWTVGVNRNSNYNGAYYFKGESRGSLVNRFVERANRGGALNQFEEQLAYETGAIYRKDASVPFKSDFDGYNDVPIVKSQLGATSGRVNEMMFGYAANYREKFQVGVALGVPFVRFQDNRIYRESDTETATDIGRIPSFKELTFRENYNVSGTGINAKIGLIYKPLYSVRLGFSAQTPTRYFLSEGYNNNFNYQYIDVNPSGGLVQGNETSRSPDGAFDYKINTPWRFTASSAYVIGKNGFISADLDFLNYSRMNFEYGIEDKDAQQSVNSDIRADYVSTANLRLGAELAVDIFRLRAGLATLGLPSKATNTGYFENAAKMLSLGAGIRENHFYFDLAYQFIRTSDVFSPYQVSTDYEQTVVNRTRNNSLIVATAGFKF